MLEWYRRRLKGWIYRLSERIILGRTETTTLTPDYGDHYYIFAVHSDGMRLIHWPGKDSGALPFPDSGDESAESPPEASDSRHP